MHDTAKNHPRSTSVAKQNPILVRFRAAAYSFGDSDGCAVTTVLW